MKVTLFTSGSTKEPKQITHIDMLPHIQRSVKEIGLRKDDIVLDVFPANVIAHYTVTAQPALLAGAHLITAAFEPYNYIRLFKKYNPTYISLIPRHYEILSKTKEWKDLDMRSVRYMVTGSGPISQTMIDDFLSKGVRTVANWYGMTEFPPPVFVGYNSESFDFKSTYDIGFTEEGECVIDRILTGDFFDVNTGKFLYRKLPIKHETWKNV